MEVFEFALEFEKKHRAYYLDLAQKTGNKYLKKLFEDLAGEEKKHAELVETLSEKREASYVESDILPRAKEALEKMASNFNDKDSAFPEDQVEIYKKARKVEEETYNFYHKNAEKTDLEFVRKAFAQLAEEERKHEVFLRNLIEFVDRPNTWLDDAEWYHHERY